MKSEVFPVAVKEVGMENPAEETCDWGKPLNTVLLLFQTNAIEKIEKKGPHFKVFKYSTSASIWASVITPS